VEIMKTEVATCHPGETLAVAAERMWLVGLMSRHDRAPAVACQGA
jgi:hypothetical protein